MEPIKLTLYICGKSPLSDTALQSMQRLCSLYKIAEYSVVDVSQEPEKGDQERIIATPTLVKKDNDRPRRVVGDLSDITKVSMLLGLPGLEKKDSTNET